MSITKRAVQDRYAKAAREMSAAPGACCGDACGCESSDYSAQDLQLIGLSQSVSLGCGNPTLLAALNPGEKVLDLGSGGGMDVLLSARRVGPTGHAYGVDMTDEMLELAEANRARAGARNATFLKGTIEAVPLPDGATARTYLYGGRRGDELPLRVIAQAPGYLTETGRAIVLVDFPLRDEDDVRSAVSAALDGRANAVLVQQEHDADQAGGQQPIRQRAHDARRILDEQRILSTGSEPQPPEVVRIGRDHRQDRADCPWQREQLADGPA